MILHYSSSKQEKILTNIRLLKKEYSAHYEAIQNRLSELLNANCLSEIPNVPPPRRHKLTNSKKYINCWGIDYSKNYRIIVAPVGNFDINDLRTITEIKIIKLEDYH